MKLRYLGLLTLLFLTVPAVQAAERQKVGLVLGGGGAKGFAHLGVIKVLEANRVPIDCITGTSMGALVGGVVATGMPIQEIESRVQKADWAAFFSNRIGRQEEVFVRKEDDRINTMDLRIPARNGRVGLPKGAVRTQKIELFIRELTQSVSPESFDLLPIPYRAIATNLETGELVEFARGDLAVAMRASMSVPGLFEPVENDGLLLVDGGLARNIPIDNARTLCKPDVLIVVDVGAPPLDREQMSSVLGVTQQMVEVGINNNVKQQLSTLGGRDILVSPKLGDLGASDFERHAEFIPLGEQAANAVLPRLQALSLSEPDYQAYKNERHQRRLSAGNIDVIQIAPLKTVNPKLVDAMVSQPLGQPFDQSRLHSDLIQLYGRGDFDRIDYGLEKDGKQQVLHLRPYEKSAGPDEIHLGLRVQSEVGAATDFDLSASYYKYWANHWGAIWKIHADLGSNPYLATEWYQPLDYNSPWFVAPYYAYTRTSDDVYLPGSDSLVAEYQYTRRSAGVSLGYSLGSWGEVRTGPVWSQAAYRRQVGDPRLPELDENVSGWQAKLAFDKVDNAKFPNNGVVGNIKAYWGLRSFNADVDYKKYSADWLGAYNVKGNVMSIALRGGRSPNAPYYEYFRLGGLFNLTGYHQDELAGDSYVYGRLGYARRWNSPYTNGVYGGIMAESGATWLPGQARSASDMKYSGTLYLGADTLLGPVYVGYGRAEAGRQAFYLLIGSSDLNMRR